MPDSLINLFKSAESCLPFCVVGANGSPKLNVAKIGESLITAGLIAFFCWYVFVEKELTIMKKDINTQKNSIVRIEEQVGKIYNDIYRPTIKP